MMGASKETWKLFDPISYYKFTLNAEWINNVKNDIIDLIDNH